jgi:thermostable 8-oxoguanine DNA glycosylase
MPKLNRGWIEDTLYLIEGDLSETIREARARKYSKPSRYIEAAVRGLQEVREALEAERKDAEKQRAPAPPMVTSEDDIPF